MDISIILYVHHLCIIRSSRYLYEDDGSTTGYMENKVANTTIMFTHDSTM